MTPSPLHAKFAGSDALLIPYGLGADTVDVVGAFEEVGIEYAAIRKGCVLFDMPHVGTVEVRGSERLAFLNSMITQRVIDLEADLSRRSFWLNRKGRIEADIRLCGREGRVLLSLDRHLAGPTAESLGGFVFSEDAEVVDISSESHRMSLHGVAALAVLAAASGSEEAASLEPGRNMALQIAGVDVIADREDLTGDPGVELCMPTEHARGVYEELLRLRADASSVKPAGWFALNTARIEAGQPMFNTDFAGDNLPMETGVIGSRVDFKKGCYLGQEVVARMDARKVRKRGLVALRVMPGQDGQAALPSQGDRVYAADDVGGSVIGSVTSSTLAPMVSGASVAFAMLRDQETKPGTEVVLSAEGKPARAVVQDSLRFWSRSGA
jgi:tRNA-modifying protein YgfZ